MYYSHYNYLYNHSAAPVLSVAVVGFLVLVTLLILAVAYVINAFLLSFIFKKTGTPRWIAWVPFYNFWKFLELGNQQGFWAILAIIPFVNYASAVFMYIAAYHVGRKFGKDGTWVVLGIFLPTVWLAILAFDGSKWHDKKPVS